MEYENDKNPYTERSLQIEKWQSLAAVDCDFSNDLFNMAKKFISLGLREKDAYHVACAISSNADCFITTDSKILNKNIPDIRLISPIDFIYITEGSI